MRNRLIELIISADVSLFGSDKSYAEVYADYLLENGVVVPPSAGSKQKNRWLKSGMNEKTCSVCKFIYYGNKDEWNYCPNCGAKMDVKGE